MTREQFDKLINAIDNVANVLLILQGSALFMLLLILCAILSGNRQ